MLFIRKGKEIEEAQKMRTNEIVKHKETTNF